MTSLDAALDRFVPTVDRLVDEGGLLGWEAGVADDTGLRVRSGGHHRPAAAAGPATVTGPATTSPRPTPGTTQFAMSSNSKPVGGALALRLVELGAVALDEPVDPWLPELAGPRVLVSPEADLTATVPAEQPITLRHLLTMTPGFGWVSEPGPLATALGEQHLAPGPWGPPLSHDEFMARLGELPLADQPGTAWRYHTSSDVLGVLLARATGQSLEHLLEEHVLTPLGLTDTGFRGDPARLAAVHGTDDDGRLTPFAIPPGTYVDPPAFPSLAAGLVSTVPDQLAFLRSLVGGPSVLSPQTLRDLRTDSLTPQRRRTAAGTIAPDCGWGLHVEIRPTGAIGWAGGLGTIGYADPSTGRAAFLATQVTFDAPATATAVDAFWGLLT